MRKALLIIAAIALVLATAGAGLALADDDDAADGVPHTERPEAALQIDPHDGWLTYQINGAGAAQWAVNVQAVQTIGLLKAVKYGEDLEAEAARQAEAAARAAEQAARTSRASSSASSRSTSSSGESGGGGGGAGGRLACIRNHESGGNYSTNTGNGYYGAYQFSQSTWESVGGTGNPASASPAEQDARAQQLLGSGGIGHWPNANC